MSNPFPKQDGRTVQVEVPVVFVVSVRAGSQEETQQRARAAIDRHLGFAPQVQPAGLSDVDGTNIERCEHQPAPGPVQVLIHLGQDGEAPTVHCSVACDVATVRSDCDLEDYDESDIFSIPIFYSGSGPDTQLCVGHIDHAVDRTVGQQQAEQLHIKLVFQAIARHQEGDSAAEAPSAPVSSL